MKNLSIITQREYLNKVRNKSFVIMTFVSPLILIIFGALVAYLTQVNNSGAAKEIVVLDESGLFEGTFKPTESATYEYRTGGSLKDAKAAVLAKGKYGLLYIPNDSLPQVQFFSEETPPLSLVNTLTQAVENTLFQKNLTAKGIKAADIEKAKTKVNLQLENFTGERSSEIDSILKIAIGGAAGYLIFMFIIIYGNLIMRSVIEEKTNRIVEIIISSVRPQTLLLGKIFGSSLAGLTQFAIWIVIGGVGLALLPSFFPVAAPRVGELPMSDMSSILTAVSHFPFAELSLLFLLFFIGGYLLYSAIFATIGAMVDNETDTQQFIIPVLLPLILAVYVGMYSVIEEPHGTVSVVFSYISLTSPVVMLMRVPFGVAWWEVLLSLLALYASFLLVIRLAGKIYRIGILIYGKKASYKDIWKWLRQ